MAKIIIVLSFFLQLLIVNWHLTFILRLFQLIRKALVIFLLTWIKFDGVVIKIAFFSWNVRLETTPKSAKNTGPWVPRCMNTIQWLQNVLLLTIRNMQFSYIEVNDSSISTGQQFRKSNMTAPMHWYNWNERWTSYLVVGLLFVKSIKYQQKGFKFYTFIRETLQYSDREWSRSTFMKYMKTYLLLSKTRRLIYIIYNRQTGNCCKWNTTPTILMSLLEL